MRTVLFVGLALALAGGVLAGRELSRTATADDGGRPFTTALSGAAEVPGPGDPDGSGTASLRLNPGQGEVCFTLTVSGIAPATAAHIHVAPAGVAGPIVVPLTPPTSGSSSGCATADRTLIREIIRNPEAYYVNVHNADFPAGALRGQLGK
ncbi:MAG: CHRD domain-containing protein [Dehalococcoidia bacterium]